MTVPGGDIADDLVATPLEPSSGVKARYWLGLSIPEKYRRWVKSDVASPLFPIRLFLYQFLGVLLVTSCLSLMVDYPHRWAYLLGFSMGGVITTIFFADGTRRRSLRWHEKRWNRARELQQNPDLPHFP